MLVVADTSALLALVGSVGLYDAAGSLVEVPSAETYELGAVQTWAWEVPVQSAQAVRAEISRIDAFPR